MHSCPSFSSRASADLYDDLNLVNGRIKNENRDGYAGIASTVQEAVNLACRLYEDQQLTGDCIYFAWHDIGVFSAHAAAAAIFLHSC